MNVSLIPSPSGVNELGAKRLKSFKISIGLVTVEMQLF